jgi:hypothetical protein
MYAIGRDELGYWEKMGYDSAYSEIEGLYSHFNAFHKQHQIEDFETVVLAYLRSQLPDTTQI